MSNWLHVKGVDHGCHAFVPYGDKAFGLRRFVPWVQRKDFFHDNKKAVLGLPSGKEGGQRDFLEILKKLNAKLRVLSLFCLKFNDFFFFF